MKLYSQIILLFLVLNPLGNTPIFISILKPIDPKRHTKIIIREVAIATVALAIFMFFGQYLLRGMQISEQALGISGGIILFLIALRMIFPEHEVNDKAVSGEPFIVPLAIPVTAGPAAMATVMLFGSQNVGRIGESIFVLIISSLLACGVLLGSRYLGRILGEKGLIALERLSGMLLTAMAVQMFLTGLENYFRLH